MKNQRFKNRRREITVMRELYGVGVGTASGGWVHGGLLNGFKGFTPRAQGAGGFDGMYGTSGVSALRGEGDICCDVPASAGANSEIPPSLSMWQLWSCAGLFVSRGFPPASTHSYTAAQVRLGDAGHRLINKTTDKTVQDIRP